MKHRGAQRLGRQDLPAQEILKPERRYVIPTFQRDYEWTRKGQWELLFDDLATTADRLIDVRTSGDEGSKLKTREQSISPNPRCDRLCEPSFRHGRRGAEISHRRSAAADRRALACSYGVCSMCSPRREVSVRNPCDACCSILMTWSRRPMRSTSCGRDAKIERSGRPRWGSRTEQWCRPPLSGREAILCRGIERLCPCRRRD